MCTHVSHVPAKVGVFMALGAARIWCCLGVQRSMTGPDRNGTSCAAWRGKLATG